jgi:hypothetical protein
MMLEIQVLAVFVMYNQDDKVHICGNDLIL